MADNQTTVVGAKIQIDTGDSNQQIKTTNKELGSLGSAVKSVKGETGGVTSNFLNIKSSLSGLPGPAKAATEGIGGLNQMFNLLRANPIIAVITLIAGLIVALASKFSKMEAVGDSLGKAFGNLGTIISRIINAVLKPLIEVFTKIVEVVTAAADFIVGIFSPGLSEAAKRSGELTDQLDNLKDAEEASAIARAESNRKLQEARELAGDANVPIKERIKALEEAGRIEREELQNSINIAQTRARIVLEQIALELDAREELIQKIRQGSIEELKAAREELFNRDDIDKEKLKGATDDLIAAEEQGAELAKINKKTNAAISSLEKEEQSKRESAAKEAESKRKAAAQKAEQERKAEIARRAEFESKLLKQQQENAILQINDGYEKERALLNQKLSNEADALKKDFENKKLTKDEYDQLSSLQETQAFIQRQQLTDKHNAEVKAKEEAFQKELNDIRFKLMVDGIVDQREKQRALDDQEYQNKLADTIARYKDDKGKQLLLTQAINDEYNALVSKREAAYKLEDDKKKLADEEAAQKAIIEAQDANFQSKIDALNAEQEIFKQALDNKVLSELEYNQKVKDLSDKRIQIGQLEADYKKKQTEEVAGVLSKLADIVGKQTVASKALGIANALINTYQGATDALRAKSVLPSPFDVIAKVANVASVIATGIKSVKAITAVQVPGGGGGGVSTPSVTPSSPISPQATTTTLDQNSISQIGNATNRSFVLESDVSNNQERLVRLNRASRLGG